MKIPSESSYCAHLRGRFESSMIALQILVRAHGTNTALLNGPPGSVKTSLAQALAQKLPNRLPDIYSRTKLLQVDADAIFSHMYGETAKQISSLFTSIRRLASDGDEAQLIVVLIDEIDKLVPCRKNVGKKNEPLHTMRVSTSLLIVGYILVY